MTLKKWFDQNILSLNISKTKFMPIFLHPNSEYILTELIIHQCGNHTSTTCGCEKIKLVKSYKYLGVVFDSRLKWSEHADYLLKKIRKYIYAFRKLSEILDGNEIKLAYYAYVQSLLSFGNIAWGGAPKTLLEPLFITQKSILKAGLRKNMRYPTDSLFQESSLLSLRQLFIKHILIHIYKNIDRIFPELMHSYQTRYSENVGIHVIRLEKSFSKTNAYYISHILFRNICNNFQHLNLFGSDSIAVFKKRVTELLIQIGVQGSEAFILPDWRPT